jgi:uncharacterized protein
MATRYRDVATTPSVAAVQQVCAGWHYKPTPEGERQRDRLTRTERDFIEARDSFYMATVSETGWPYVQHRGGPKGFLRVLDATSLAFADYRGNQHYVSTGNLMVNNRASLLLMDYPRRRRLKIYASITLVSPRDDGELLERVLIPEYHARIERIMVLRVEAFDWNCPQHIAPRYTIEELEHHTAALHRRVEELERMINGAGGER